MPVRKTAPKGDASRVGPVADNAHGAHTAKSVKYNLTCKPPRMEISESGIPDECKRLPRWMGWRWALNENRTGWTKPPVIVGGTGGASSTNPKTWRDFAAALHAARNGGNLDGIGFALGDGFAGLDCDGCRNPATGEIAPEVLAIIHELNSYTEVSPSGEGVKILLKAHKPIGRCKTHDGKFEFYDTGRYFTMTGIRVEGTPASLASGPDAQAAYERVHARLMATQPPRKRNATTTRKAATSGGRHDLLLDAAVVARKEGKGGQDLLAAVRDVNLQQCKPPKDDAEVERICSWVDANIEPNAASVLQSPSGPVSFEIERPKGVRRANVTAKLNGSVLLMDAVNLVEARARRKFAQAVADQSGASVGEVDRLLMAAAAQPESETTPALDPKEEGLRRLDDAATAGLLEASDAVINEAKLMLAAPDLMDIVVRDVQALGVAGEDELIAGLYACFTSRLLNEPVSSKVQGTSSSGKSFISGKVGELIPPESIFIATDITANALYYVLLGRLVHNVVLAGEKSRIQDDQAAEATRALREMISSGRLSKAVTVNVNGELKTIHIEQPGPISHCETTTLTEMFDEDANRCILFASDESAAQSERVLEKRARRAMGFEIDAGPIIAKHHAAQRMLKRVRVIIPFADRLSAAMPLHLPQVRRAFNQLLGLTEAIATLHQYQRSQSAPEHGDTIKAALNDFAVARHILLRPLARALGAALSDSVVRFGGWLLEVEPQLPGTEGINAGRPQFTNSDLGKLADCPISDRSARWRYLTKLVDVGFLKLLDSGKGKTKHYRIAMDSVPDSDASKWLPEVEELQ